jgi:hypothetical protein
MFTLLAEGPKPVGTANTPVNPVRAKRRLEKATILISSYIFVFGGNAVMESS